MGIALNLLLFAAKCIVGVVSGSVAIAADALNNLSDAGSSLVALLGFRLAGKKPDHDHPFGHGRLEYVSGLAVAGLILLMAVELAKSSVERILHPQAVTFTAVTAAVLVASIAIKLYMYAYNRSIGRRIQSAALLATAADSRSDALGTAVVLLSMVLGRVTALPLDGWVGLLVAAAIFVTGVKAARETISPLLGRAPEPELVASIRAIVLSHKSIRGIHDLVVHDYGPGRVMITLHAEVPAGGDILALHDDIDLAERELAEQLGCVATIHMDPIVDDDATHATSAWCPAPAIPISSSTPWCPMMKPCPTARWPAAFARPSQPCPAAPITPLSPWKHPTCKMRRYKRCSSRLKPCAKWWRAATTSSFSVAPACPPRAAFRISAAWTACTTRSSPIPRKPC